MASDFIARRPQIHRNRPGLRLRISKIPGVTKGDAAKVLHHPYKFQCPPLDTFAVPRSRTFNRRTTYKGDTKLTRAGLVPITLTYQTILIEWGNFAVTADFDVDKLIRQLERIHDAGWPFHFLATHPYHRKPEANFYAVLESMQVSDKHGEDDARYIDLTVTEWDRSTVKAKGKGGIKDRKGGKEYPIIVTMTKDGHYGFPDHKTVHLQAPPLTLEKLAIMAYGRPTLADHIAAHQKPPIRNFGYRSPLYRLSRFRKHGGKLIVPEPPPIASINDPKDMGGLVIVDG